MLLGEVIFRGAQDLRGGEVSRYARSWALEESNNAVLDLFLERVDAEVNLLAPLTVGGRLRHESRGGKRVRREARRHRWKSTPKQFTLHPEP